MKKPLSDVIIVRFDKWTLCDNDTVFPAPNRFAVYHRSGTYRVVGPDAKIYKALSIEIDAVEEARCLNRALDLGAKNLPG
jgi:hypothetical protein